APYVCRAVGPHTCGRAAAHIPLREDRSIPFQVADQGEQTRGGETWYLISCEGIFLKVFIRAVRDVDGCCFVIGTARGALDFAIVVKPDHHEVMSVNKLREAVAFDKHAWRFHALEGFFNSLLNLVVSTNQ